MTVQSTFSRISQNGNGVVTEFPVSFIFFDSGDLRVFLVSAEGHSTLLQQGSDYVVSGGDGNAGSITLTTAPGTGERVVIERQIPATQPVKYITGGAFPAETHERALDRLTLLVQQLKDELDRSLSLPATTQSQADLTLPEPETGKFLGFGDNGQLILRDLAMLGVINLPLNGDQVTGIDGTSLDAGFTHQAGQKLVANLDTLSWSSAMTLNAATPLPALVLGGDTTFNVTGATGKAAISHIEIDNSGGHALALGTGWTGDWTTDATEDLFVLVVVQHGTRVRGYVV